MSAFDQMVALCRQRVSSSTPTRSAPQESYNRSVLTSLIELKGLLGHCYVSGWFSNSSFEQLQQKDPPNQEWGVLLRQRYSGQ